MKKQGGENKLNQLKGDIASPAHEFEGFGELEISKIGRETPELVNEEDWRLKYKSTVQRRAEVDDHKELSEFISLIP